MSERVRYGQHCSVSGPPENDEPGTAEVRSYKLTNFPKTRTTGVALQSRPARLDGALVEVGVDDYEGRGSNRARSRELSRDAFFVPR